MIARLTGWGIFNSSSHWDAQGALCWLHSICDKVVDFADFMSLFLCGLLLCFCVVSPVDPPPLMMTNADDDKPSPLLMADRIPLFRILNAHPC